MIRRRAPSSGITLDYEDATVVKGMLSRGDRQHDIAAWFGVNGGRIAEIATGKTFGSAPCADINDLPPMGPYPSGREAIAAIKALELARQVILNAESQIIKDIGRK